MIGRRKPEILLVLATLIWGGTFSAIKGSLQDVSPLLQIALRFLIAAPLAWILLIGMNRGAPLHRFTPGAWKWGWIISLGMFAGFAGQTIGLRYTSVARSGFITYTFALYVPFLQFLFLRRKPAWGNLLGLLAAVGGLILITNPRGGAFNKGDLFTLIGALGYAFHVTLLGKATDAEDPGAVMVIQFLFCGLFAAFAAALWETPFLVVTWRLAGSMTYLILFGSLLALSLMNWFQRHVSPLRAVLIYALEPVFAALIGWIALREGMTGMEMIGSLLILVGILVSDLWAALHRRRRYADNRGDER